MAQKVSRWADATGCVHDTKIEADLADTVAQIQAYIETSREAWGINDAQFATHAAAFHELLTRYLRLMKAKAAKGGG